MLKAYGLRFSGHFDGGNAEEFASAIRTQLDAGAETINVQLADHDEPDDPGRTLDNIPLTMHFHMGCPTLYGLFPFGRIGGIVSIKEGYEADFMALIAELLGKLKRNESPR